MRAEEGMAGWGAEGGKGRRKYGSQEDSRLARLFKGDVFLKGPILPFARPLSL